MPLNLFHDAAVASIARVRDRTAPYSAMRAASTTTIAPETTRGGGDAGRARTGGRARRRDAMMISMIASANAALVVDARDARAAGQPIDWLLKSAVDEDVDLLEIIKASATGDVEAGSETWRRERAGTKKMDVEASSEAKEPVDVGETATKFGKLGAILLLADVVTAAIMGKSVLGVAKSLEREMELDEDGNVVEVKNEAVQSGDWKDAMADKLMAKLKEKAVDSSEGGDESSKER